MVKNTFTFSAAAMVVVLSILAGIGVTTILTTVYAQTDLGDWKDNGSERNYPNRTQVTYSDNGTLKVA